MKVDADTLRRMYLDEGKTIDSIAKELQVATRTVEDGLIRWRIPRRRTQEHRIPAILTHPEIETVLRYLYIDEGYNSSAIAELLQVSRASVLNALKRWNIPVLDKKRIQQELPSLFRIQYCSLDHEAAQ